MSWQRGFTLIEVLLAMVLLAAGLALGLATLRAATATVERGQALARQGERMRAVEGFLRRRLSSALPIGFALDPDSGRVMRFIGEPERMRFVADLPDYLGRGGPHLHDIQMLESDAHARLAVSFAMVLAGRTLPADVPETLADDLVSIRFRYRGLDQRRQPSAWREHWDYPEILPLQVSIRIETMSAGMWPELVVLLPQGGMATIPEGAP